MKRCGVCRMLNIEGAETCSRCGHQLASLALGAGMKVAWIGFAIAIVGGLVMWAVSVSGDGGFYPFGLFALGLGLLSILAGLLSWGFSS